MTQLATSITITLANQLRALQRLARGGGEHSGADTQAPAPETPQIEADAIVARVSGWIESYWRWRRGDDWRGEEHW